MHFSPFGQQPSEIAAKPAPADLHCLRALEAVQALLTLNEDASRRRQMNASRAMPSSLPRPLGLGHEQPLRPAFPWVV